jgi:FlaA1/EpsC-like NDP-sugar epimerase
MFQNLVIKHRRALVIAVHLMLWTCALAVSFLLRFEFTLPPFYRPIALKLLTVTLVVRGLVHWRFGLFHGLWRYSGARDLIALIKAATVSSLIVASIWAFMATGTFPRSILILDFAFSILAVGGVRLSIRTLREALVQSARPPESVGQRRKRILVIGAGDAGEALMRELVRIYGHRYEPVGFLDDAPSKQLARIHGVPVIGTIADVEKVAAREEIDEIILAIPTMTGRDMRTVLELCRPTRATVRTLPGVDSLIDGRATVSQLAEVAIEDLLGRAPVTLDTEQVAKLVRGRAVLVTGAGGSIGSELCKQICRFKPKTLILVEQAENNLFEAHRALAAEFDEVSVVPYVADICDKRRLETIFETERPALVFHAAAHKHVPMMESNPGEAVKNNVFGTKTVADTADQFGVEKFVMVSTDKAVNPTSVMGVSKRTAEIYIQALSQRSKTLFATVRFGNVLGSAGSVIPIFKQQIAKGGPVTVTHPEMQRYFMTIPEACQLILQAGAMCSGGDIFILDMGSPVKIVDLARDLIRLSGLEPDHDIAIEFSGIRPGEKLFEELTFNAEKAEKTRHPKIFVGIHRTYDRAEVDAALAGLLRLSDGGKPDDIRAAFRVLVPEYGPPRHEAPPLPAPEPVAEPVDMTPSLSLAAERPSITAI